MRTLDTLTAWILIALGAAHIALTRRVNPHIDISAIWFASGGLLIIAIGTLNLLRVAYSRVARGIYVVSVVANIVLVLLMLSFAAVLPIRSNAQVLLGLILAVLLTAFSLIESSLFGRWPKILERYHSHGAHSAVLFFVHA